MRTFRTFRMLATAFLVWLAFMVGIKYQQFADKHPDIRAQLHTHGKNTYFMLFFVLLLIGVMLWIFWKTGESKSAVRTQAVGLLSIILTVSWWGLKIMQPMDWRAGKYFVLTYGSLAVITALVLWLNRPESNSKTKSRGKHAAQPQQVPAQTTQMELVDDHDLAHA